ncbi:lysozyme inhibitor LprI family protein [Ferruginibacter sp.]
MITARLTKQFVLLQVFICCSCCAVAQTEKTMEELYNKHQACLDSGVNMVGCSRDYYLQMDSMLNIAYNKLRSQLSETAKTTLRDEQRTWIKKRDIYFAKQDKRFQINLTKRIWGTDMIMITYDDKAKYVEERVLVLIKRIK